MSEHERERERERDVGEVLTAVVALSRDIAAERRTPFEGADLTPTQLELLFLLAHSDEDVTPGAAAARLGITAGAVTQLVDGLRAAGLVESAPNPADRRSRILRLTHAQRSRIATFEHGVVQRLLPRFASLGDADLRTLARLIARVGDER